MRLVPRGLIVEAFGLGGIGGTENMSGAEEEEACSAAAAARRETTE